MEKRTIQLNDGTCLPRIGFGVFRMDPDTCERAVQQAFEAGYRLIDTANSYMNEKAVGRAMKKSGLPRKEMILTTKIMPIDFGYAKTRKAIAETLDRLDTPYIDLLLLHIRFGDYTGAWKALEEAVRQGKVKSIGVSNFNRPQLDRILKEGTIPPAVDQLECHPFFQERKMRAYLKQNRIQAESWFPLGHGDRKLLDHPVLKAIGERHGKTTAQIILRWHVQEGLIPVVKAADPVHIRENMNIFDFVLSEDEMKEIHELDTGRSYFQDEYDKESEADRAREYLETEHPDYDSQK